MADEEDKWTEPGRWVADDGTIRYAWPPQGRFHELWVKFSSLHLTDDEKFELLALLTLWGDENSTLVAIEENGEWIDVEPDWSVPEQWLEENNG